VLLLLLVAWEILFDDEAEPTMLGRVALRISDGGGVTTRCDDELLLVLVLGGG
jgi:hypothetical protein